MKSANTTIEIIEKWLNLIQFGEFGKFVFICRCTANCFCQHLRIRCPHHIHKMTMTCNCHIYLTIKLHCLHTHFDFIQRIFLCNPNSCHIDQNDVIITLLILNITSTLIFICCSTNFFYIFTLYWSLFRHLNASNDWQSDVLNPWTYLQAYL